MKQLIPDGAKIVLCMLEGFILIKNIRCNFANNSCTVIHVKTLKYLDYNVERKLNPTPSPPVGASYPRGGSWVLFNGSGEVNSMSGRFGRNFITCFHCSQFSVCPVCKLCANMLVFVFRVWDLGRRRPYWKINLWPPQHMWKLTKCCTRVRSGDLSRFSSSAQNLSSPRDFIRTTRNSSSSVSRHGQFKVITEDFFFRTA